MKRQVTLEEIRLPCGLFTLLEKEAQRRNCTVSVLIEHAVRSELEEAERVSAPNPAGSAKPSEPRSAG